MIEKLEIEFDKVRASNFVQQGPSNIQIMAKLNEVIDYLNENAADRKQPAPLTGFTLHALKGYLAKELPYEFKLTDVLEAIGRFENGER